MRITVLFVLLACWFSVVCAEDAASVPHPFEPAVYRGDTTPYPIQVAAMLSNANDVDEIEVEVVEEQTIPAPSQLPVLTPATGRRAEPLPVLPVPVAPILPTPVIPATAAMPVMPAAPVYSFRHYGTRMLDNLTCDACGLVGCGRKHRNSLFFDAWLAHGVSLNNRGTNKLDNTNAPLRFTDLGNEYALNQLYLSFGREVRRRPDRFDLGFRADILYGSDYFWTSALGLETRTYKTFFDDPEEHITTLDPRSADARWNSGGTDLRQRYGLSLPQVYAEMFMPFGDGTTLKVGHFYSEFGLESVMAPKNLFYSHSYSFMFGSPITVTGGSLTQRFGRRLSVTAGITSGWDIWDNPEHDLSFFAGATWKRSDTGTELSWVVNSGRTTELKTNGQRTHYVLTLRQRLTSYLNLGIEHTMGWEPDGIEYRFDAADNLEYRDSRWASIASMLEARINPRLSVSMRGEWFRDENTGRVTKMPTLGIGDSISGQNYYALTCGLRWQPHRAVTVRPELRYDWSDIRLQPGNTGVFSGRNDLLTTSLDMIIRF